MTNSELNNPCPTCDHGNYKGNVCPDCGRTILHEETGTVQPPKPYTYYDPKNCPINGCHMTIRHHHGDYDPTPDTTDSGVRENRTVDTTDKEDRYLVIDGRQVHISDLAPSEQEKLRQVEPAGRLIDNLIQDAEVAALLDKGMYAEMDNNLMNRQTLARGIQALITAHTTEALQRVREAVIPAGKIFPYETEDGLHQIQQFSRNLGSAISKELTNGGQE